MTSAHRTKARIMYSIMEAIETSHNGAIISTITRKANLSHYAVNEYLKPMLDAGLIRSAQIKQEKSGLVTTAYQLTYIGRELKAKLDDMIQYMQKLDLKVDIL